MKRTKNLLLLVFFALLFMMCEKTDDGEYVAPLTLYEKLAGQWNISSMKLVDEIAKASSIEPDDIELKTRFGFESFTITFNVDADSLPTTFQVGGDSPALFLKQGYWEMDIPFVHSDGTPSEIYLYADDARTDLKDKLIVTTLPGARPDLEFKLSRYTGSTVYVSYVFKLRLDQ
jgi:hypothetical protein